MVCKGLSFDASYHKWLLLHATYYTCRLQNKYGQRERCKDGAGVFAAHMKLDMLLKRER